MSLGEDDLEANRLMAKGVSILTLVSGFTTESAETRAGLINMLDPGNEVENQVMAMMANLAIYAHQIATDLDEPLSMALALIGQVRAESQPTKEEL